MQLGHAKNMEMRHSLEGTLKRKKKFFFRISKLQLHTTNITTLVITRYIGEQENAAKKKNAVGNTVLKFLYKSPWRRKFLWRLLGPTYSF